MGGIMGGIAFGNQYGRAVKTYMRENTTEINESPDKGNLYRTGLQQRRFLRQVFPSLRGDVTAGVSQQLSQPSYLNLFRLK